MEAEACGSKDRLQQANERGRVFFVSDPHGENRIFSQIVDGECAGLEGSVDYVHLVGDVYDRGPAAELIMDKIADMDNLDIQWGNHDVVWMGAALGNRGCIAHVVRNCARYGNLDILDAYGIDRAPLERLAATAYADDPCVAFGLKETNGLPDNLVELNVKVQKAMAIIQFKVEAQLINENPAFNLQDRKLMSAIDFAANTVVVDGIEYPLTDTVFPTVDPADPNKLTDQEETVIAALQQSFQSSERLKRHIDVLLRKGGMYHICGNDLVFHACVPLNADGSLMETDFLGRPLKGKALLDEVDLVVREAFLSKDEEVKKRGGDLLWYLWLGQGSPLFAKSKMATFEIYYIADKAARKEVKNAFYSLLDDEAAIDGVFRDFGMNPACSRIVCGHVPVKVKDGENPVRCGGKIVVIDGGMSKAYRKTTGLAGMVLVEDGVAGQRVSTLCLIGQPESDDAPAEIVEKRVL